MLRNKGARWQIHDHFVSFIDKSLVTARLRFHRPGLRTTTWPRDRTSRIRGQRFQSLRSNGMLPNVPLGGGPVDRPLDGLWSWRQGEGEGEWGVGGGWEWGVGAVVISHPRIPPHTMNIRTTSVECLWWDKRRKRGWLPFRQQNNNTEILHIHLPLCRLFDRMPIQLH